MLTAMMKVPKTQTVIQSLVRVPAPACPAARLPRTALFPLVPLRCFLHPLRFPNRALQRTRAEAPRHGLSTCRAASAAGGAAQRGEIDHDGVRLQPRAAEHADADCRLPYDRAARLQP